MNRYVFVVKDGLPDVALDTTGYWVSFTDHEAELFRLNAKISELEAENRNLKMNHSLKPTLTEALTTLMENKE